MIAPEEDVNETAYDPRAGRVRGSPTTLGVTSSPSVPTRPVSVSRGCARRCGAVPATAVRSEMRGSSPGPEDAPTLVFPTSGEEL